MHEAGPRGSDRSNVLPHTTVSPRAPAPQQLGGDSAPLGIVCKQVCTVECATNGVVTPGEIRDPDLRNEFRGTGIAAKHELETMVLDLTQPDLGLSVVKVMVPGLAHHWPRLAPGRLYDVPVAMGWLRAPREEAELTHVAIPI